MSLSICSHCKSFIPPQQSICSHCGHGYDAKNSLMKRTVLAFASTSMAITLSACYGLPPENHCPVYCYSLVERCLDNPAFFDYCEESCLIAKDSFCKEESVRCMNYCSDVSTRCYAYDTDPCEESCTSTYEEFCSMSIVDQGMSVVDQGMSVVDQGMSAVDQGMPAVDQGMSAVDQGMPAVDQGMPVVDQSMPVVEDMGIMVDQGSGSK